VAEGPGDGELQAAKNKIASRGTLKGEIPMGRLSAVGSDWVYAGRYEPLAEKIERIFAVTRDEVHQLAQAAAIDKMDIYTLGPAGDFLT
jgi:predicted Zn-dependent peptidase